MQHNTHGFEEETNEHDVIDKGDDYVRWGITPRTVQSEWVVKLKNKAGEEWQSSCTDHYAWKAAEYIIELEKELMVHRTSAKLFEDGDFISHAGLPLAWKIECDAIRPEEWHTLAKMIREYEPQKWSKAVGIPRGGVALGNALDAYSTGDPEDPILIADDVYTTGTSFREFKQENYADTATIEWCIFARTPTSGKTKALFTMPDKGKLGTNWLA